MRQLQWNSIREISVSIYYRQNYQAGFSQPAPPANWLHMLQRFFHTIMGCKKNALKFSSFLKKVREWCKHGGNFHIQLLHCASPPELPRAQ